MAAVPLRLILMSLIVGNGLTDYIYYDTPLFTLRTFAYKKYGEAFLSLKDTSWLKILRIYISSSLTIVAAMGENADVGLPGVVLIE